MGGRHFCLIPGAGSNSLRLIFRLIRLHFLQRSPARISLRKRLVRPTPESKWSIAVTEGLIVGSDEVGGSKSLALEELSGAAIATNDSGPWGTDVRWLLYGQGDRLACSFPQDATGEEEAVIDILMAMPGFDHGEKIKAMASTTNAAFPERRRTSP